MLNHPSIHTSTLPSTHTGPSGYTPPSHWLVHKFCAHHLYFPLTLLIFDVHAPILGQHHLQHHLQHHHTTTSPPHGHPIPGPWGCYVHTWNGQGGLCPSLLDWVLLQHCHRACAKPCRAGLPIFPPTIGSLDDSLSPGLGTITHPSNLKRLSCFFIKFYQHFDFLCMHTPYLVSTTRAAIALQP